jgi:hypothetical protein
MMLSTDAQRWIDLQYFDTDHDALQVFWVNGYKYYLCECIEVLV